MKKNDKDQQNTFKGAARIALRRMKSGYWEKFNEQLNDKRQEAVSEGNNPSLVVDYYVQKTIKTVNGGGDEDAFYQKVKKLLTEYGEVSDAIGRLIDHSVYDCMNYDQRQRYTLELSNKYVEALERFRNEKKFGW